MGVGRGDRREIKRKHLFIIAADTHASEWEEDREQTEIKEERRKVNK